MKKTLALVGSGKLAEIVVDALLAGLLPDYQLIGIYSRTKEKKRQLSTESPSGSGGDLLYQLRIPSGVAGS